jgi:hypothetical protein
VRLSHEPIVVVGADGHPEGGETLLSFSIYGKYLALAGTHESAYGGKINSLKCVLLYGSLDIFAQARAVKASYIHGFFCA